MYIYIFFFLFFLSYFFLFSFLFFKNKYKKKKKKKRSFILIKNIMSLNNTILIMVKSKINEIKYKCF